MFGRLSIVMISLAALPSIQIVCGQAKLDQKLVDFCYGGNSVEAAQMIEMGANVNTALTSATPLGGAVAYNNGPIVTLLLRKGADINGRDKNGDTALHRAITYCLEEMVGQLLKAGADVNEVNYEGRTSLEILVEGNNNRILDHNRYDSIMILLLRSGAQIGRWNKTVYPCQIYPTFLESTKKDRYGTRDFLAKNKYIIFERSSTIRECLHALANDNFPSDLQGLVEEFTGTPISEKSEKQRRTYLQKHLPYFARDAACTIL